MIPSPSITNHFSPLILRPSSFCKASSWIVGGSVFDEDGSPAKACELLEPRFLHNSPLLNSIPIAVLDAGLFEFATAVDAANSNGRAREEPTSDHRTGHHLESQGKAKCLGK